MSEQAYSTSKAIWHVERIKLLQQGLPIIPTELQIDFEAFCNDNCSFCSYRKDDGYNNPMLKLIGGESHTEDRPIGKPSVDGRIPDKILLDIPKQMIEAGIPCIEITGGGEPTLHPMFTRVLQLLGEAQLQIGLVTNGSMLTNKNIELIKKYCTWVRISMDASNQETHKKIHHTPNKAFETRIKNIKRLTVGKRNDLVLGISFIITPDNVDDIAASARLYKKVGVDNIRFSWMYDKGGMAGLTQEQIEQVVTLIPKLQDELNDETYQIFNEKNRIQTYTQKNDFDTCYFQRFVLSVGADAKCYPCCIQKYNPKYVYGNLKENTLKEIITSMNTHEFMTNLNPSRCYPCWLSPKNKSIITAVRKPVHENFI